MSNFKKQLNDEIEKRVDGEDVPSDKKGKKTNVVQFSFKYFLSTLSFCLCVIIILISWTWIKGEDTKKSLREVLPSKKTIIERVDGGLNVAHSTTTLTMPSTDDDTPHTPEHSKEGKSEKGFSPLHTDIESTKKDAKPYKENQTPFTPKTQKPLLSFVINHLGLSPSKTLRIIENFPPEVSLSFSPYGRNIDTLTDTALKGGHEIWLGLPLETQDYPLNDAGPSTLLINASTEKNRARLDSLLKNAQNYVGFVTPYNHIFKIEDANVNPAIKEIFERGYAIIDSSMSVRSFLSVLTDKKDYPHAQSNLWLDTNLSPITLNKNIRRISEYADSNKSVIVMLHPYPASLKAVQKFLNSKVADKFELAPASAQLKNN